MSRGRVPGDFDDSYSEFVKERENAMKGIRKGRELIPRDLRTLEKAYSVPANVIPQSSVMLAMAGEPSSGVKSLQQLALAAAAKPHFQKFRHELVAMAEQDKILKARPYVLHGRTGDRVWGTNLEPTMAEVLRSYEDRLGAEAAITPYYLDDYILRGLRELDERGILQYMPYKFFTDTVNEAAKTTRFKTMYY